MAGSSVLTLRLDAKLKKQLDRLSKAMNRSRSFVAAQAIQEFVALNEWQIAEIKKSLAEADAGDFANDDEVRGFMKRWAARAR
jgi:RHH-type transcriptional regulator, rel operon repressor / antitoxin RelB